MGLEGCLCLRDCDNDGNSYHLPGKFAYLAVARVQIHSVFFPHIKARGQHGQDLSSSCFGGGRTGFTWKALGNKRDPASHPN